MPLVHLPVASTEAAAIHEFATGQVKAFLVSCSVSGLEQLVGRDEVIGKRGQTARYYCGACKSAHDLHLWPERKGQPHG